MADEKRIGKIVREFAARMLEEGADSVRIFITRHPSRDGTGVFSYGVGNCYAQLGAIQEWLQMQEEMSRTRGRVIQEEQMGIHVCRDGKCKQGSKCPMADEEDCDDDDEADGRYAPE